MASAEDNKLPKKETEIGKQLRSLLKQHDEEDPGDRIVKALQSIKADDGNTHKAKCKMCGKHVQWGSKCCGIYTTELV